MSRWLNSFQPTAALVLRLVLGSCMAYHGYQKVVPHGALDHFAHMVVGMHLPYWLGYVSALTEFIGGILLIFGLLTRFAAFLTTINMLVAFATVGIHQGPGIYFYQLSLAANAFMLFTFGPGALAVDNKLGFD